MNVEVMPGIICHILVVILQLYILFETQAIYSLLISMFLFFLILYF